MRGKVNRRGASCGAGQPTELLSGHSPTRRTAIGKGVSSLRHRDTRDVVLRASPEIDDEPFQTLWVLARDQDYGIRNHVEFVPTKAGRD